MPTLLNFTGAEPFTLPPPWSRTMRPGQTGYLREDPSVVRGLIPNCPLQLNLSYIDTAAVPAGGYEALDPPDDARIASLTTLDATPVVIWEQTLADNTVYNVSAEIVARRTDSAGRARYLKNGCFYREAAGAATQQGSTATISTDIESAAGWDVAFDVSDNKVRLLVTGAAASTVHWNAKVTSLLVA